MTDAGAASGTAGEREDPSTGDDAYRGLPGAFVYAARTSESRLFRTYVAVAALLTLFVSLLFGLGVLQLVVGVAGGSGVFNLSRGFYVLVGLAVLAPVLAPVLLVARRHRRGEGRGDEDGSGDATGSASRDESVRADAREADESPIDRRYDRGLALAGYLVVASLYVGLVTTVPPAQQEPVSGVAAPVVETLYALPAAAGVAPPLAAVAVLVAVHRRLS